jgi:hypothetical protein
MPSEIQIVTLFRSRARIICPAVAIVAIPNAAKRSQWAATQAKREGMATGFPDIMCLWEGGGIAFIEFKAKGGLLRESQSEWLERLSEMGFAATVSRDPDHALDFLRGLGAPFVGRLAA